MRRSVLDQAGLLDPSYHFLLDHHLWIRMAMEAKIQHVPELWAAARWHPQAKNVAQAAGFGNEARRILEWMRTQPSLEPVLKRTQRQVLAGVQRLEARYLLDGGQPAAALRAYWRSFIHSPGYALQHSHRILYAALSLVRLNRYVDGLRATKTLRQRIQLIANLQQDFPQLAGQQKTETWPGLDLRALP